MTVFHISNSMTGISCELIFIYYLYIASVIERVLGKYNLLPHSEFTLIADPFYNYTHVKRIFRGVSRTQALKTSPIVRLKGKENALLC